MTPRFNMGFCDSNVMAVRLLSALVRLSLVGIVVCMMALPAHAQGAEPAQPAEPAGAPDNAEPAVPAEAKITPSEVAAGAGILVLLGMVWKLAILPLFARLMPGRVMEHPVRGRIYERVRIEPGISEMELVDFVGLSRKVTKHHLAQLLRARILGKVQIGERASYFVSGEIPPEVARRAALLRSDSTRAVYELYQANPTVTLRDAAMRLNRTAPTVWVTKRKLENEGLLPQRHP